VATPVHREVEYAFVEQQTDRTYYRRAIYTRLDFIIFVIYIMMNIDLLF